MRLSELQDDYLEALVASVDQWKDEVRQADDLSRKAASHKARAAKLDERLASEVRRCAQAGVPWERMVGMTGFSKTKLKRKAGL